MVYSNKDLPSQLNEPHAFELTWKNYLPSISQFNCCFQRQGIQLEENDDPLIEPAYYNDYSLYQGEAINDYLDNPRDWEFETLLPGQSDSIPREPLAIDNQNNENHDKNHRRVKQKTKASKEFYSAKTMPILQFSAETSPVLKPSLQDLTDKLSFIKNNTRLSEQEEGDETSLHTLNIQTEEQIQSVSDIDSVIASEVLDEYEITARTSHTAYQEDEIYIPSLADNAPFAFDQHPFGLFADQDDTVNEQAPGLFSLGRQFFGI
ncbi:unnamed protein product [Rhizopus stolonifer]